MDPGVLLEPQRFYGTPSGEKCCLAKEYSNFREFEEKSKNVSLLGTVLELRSATFSSKVYHCSLLVSLYVIHVILFVRYVYYIGLLEHFRL